MYKKFLNAVSTNNFFKGGDVKRNTFFKNTAMLCVLVFVSIGCGDSSAQSANQDGSRLVGTWVEVTYGVKTIVEDGCTYVFNSDGTGSKRSDSDKYSFKYAAFAGKVEMRGWKTRDDGSYYELYKDGGKFVISNDGKTLFMDLDYDSDNWLRKISGK
jgi:hypothetical protein